MAKLFVRTWTVLFSAGEGHRISLWHSIRHYRDYSYSGHHGRDTGCGAPLCENRIVGHECFLLLCFRRRMGAHDCRDDIGPLRRRRVRLKDRALDCNDGRFYRIPVLLDHLKKLCRGPEESGRINGLQAAHRKNH